MIDILFVDDQHCRPKNRSIYLAKFGILQDRPEPFVFHYETAEDGKGSYAVEPVLAKIERTPELKTVICDMMFGTPISSAESVMVRFMWRIMLPTIMRSFLRRLNPFR